MSKEKAHKNISQAVMNTYHDLLHEYLTSQPEGSLTDSDVVLLIMNLTVTITTSIYYSLKHILPTTVLDYDFMRVTIINNLKDSFEKIKTYTAKPEMMPLTIEQVKEIREKGSIIITLPDGTDKEITIDDLHIKTKDEHILKDNAKKGSLHAVDHTQKIIIPGDRPFSG